MSDGTDRDALDTRARAAATTRLDRASRAIARLAERREDVIAVVRELASCVARGATVITCGNGGSAAEALHLAEELVGRYRSDRDPIAALCLNADPTAITCIANDFGFDEIFARPLHVLGRPGDLLVVFSTSGRSANVLRALETARAGGVRTLGLLGGDGGPAAAACDLSFVAPGEDSASIQECHQIVMHAMCEALEPD